ncbi:hypothetical protein BU15DRAFT_62440 [Melanogaster broomeanus]|nr:hypothetical protein BU15DRAFT_62440 [Melanogaster broomeanus]
MAIGKLLLLPAVPKYTIVLPTNYAQTSRMGARTSTGRHPGQGCFWSMTLAEYSVLFAASDYCAPGLSQSIIKHLVHNSDPQRALAQISSLNPAFLAGSILNIAGGLLRIHCYRVLGRMFTFELSIRKDHKLVTSGPYSVVRHPVTRASFAWCLEDYFAVSLITRGSWFVRGCSQAWTLNRG